MNAAPDRQQRVRPPSDERGGARREYARRIDCTGSEERRTRTPQPARGRGPRRDGAFSTRADEPPVA